MLGMSFLNKPSGPQADGRYCPACRGRLSDGDATIAVRGMRFHTGCARYRVRARTVPDAAR